MTGHLELWVLGLLAAVAGLVMLSNRLGVPYPVFLVLGGSRWALFPSCPRSGYRRIVTILEGESHINDGTALVLYSVAVSAVVTGTFSLPKAALEFVLYGVGGTAIGLIVGWVISRMRRWIGDPLVEITITLFTPYAAYIPAEELGVSGVLATVAAGLYLGWRNPETTAPRNRLQSFGLWEVLTFLLNSVLFILIGLQLPNILESISGGNSMMSVVLYAALVSLAVIGTRLHWTFPATYLPRYLSRFMRECNPSPPWQQVAVIAYTGMRGTISLVAALLRLRSEGRISDEVRRRVERDLDLEDARLEI
jgi:NhaP-type Na+/H+ or K+/H+ antiporter